MGIVTETAPARKNEASQEAPRYAVCPGDRFLLVRDEWLTDWQALVDAAPRTEPSEQHPEGIRSYRGQAPALAAFLHCIVEGAGAEGVWTDRPVACSAERLARSLPWSVRTFERLDTRRYFAALVTIERGRALPRRTDRKHFHMVHEGVLRRLLAECGADHCDRADGDVLAGGSVLKVWVPVVRMLGAAARTGRPAAELSLRQLAAMARVSIKTARKALLWLRVAGLLDDSRPASKGLSRVEPSGPKDSGWRYPVREVYTSSALTPAQVTPPRAAFVLSAKVAALVELTHAAEAVDNAAAAVEIVDNAAAAVEIPAVEAVAVLLDTDKAPPSEAQRSPSPTGSDLRSTKTQHRARARGGRSVEASPAPPAQGSLATLAEAAAPPSVARVPSAAPTSPVTAAGAAAGDTPDQRRAGRLKKEGVDRLAGRLVEALGRPDASPLTPLRGHEADVWHFRTIARLAGSWDRLLTICEVERLALTDADNAVKWLAKTLKMRHDAGELDGEAYTPSRTQERLAKRAASDPSVAEPARAACHAAAARAAVEDEARARAADPERARALRLMVQVHDVAVRIGGWSRDGRRDADWPSHERARTLRDVMAWDREARGLGALDESSAELLAGDVEWIRGELALAVVDVPAPVTVAPGETSFKRESADEERERRREAMRRAMAAPREPAPVELVPMRIDTDERERRREAMHTALAAWKATRLPRPRR